LSFILFSIFQTGAKVTIKTVVRWQENSSFANFELQGWLAAVCKCAVLCGGVSFDSS
jgi:hypothetical protein